MPGPEASPGFVRRSEAMTGVKRRSERRAKQAGSRIGPAGTVFAIRSLGRNVPPVVVFVGVLVMRGQRPGRVGGALLLDGYGPRTI